jgi:hypothetical protein
VVDSERQKGKAGNGRDERREVEGCKYLVLLSSCCALIRSGLAQVRVAPS